MTVKITHRLACTLTTLALALPNAGCHLALEALEKSNQARRDDRARVALEKACADKDVKTLQKVYSSRNEDHAFAQRCVAEIKVAALLDAECDTWNATFDPLDKGAKLDKSVALSAYTDEAERKEKATSLAKKALQCGTTRFLLGSYRVAEDGVKWAEIIDGLDADRIYALLRDDLRDKTGIVASGQAEIAIAWLLRNQEKDRCAELETVTREPKKPHPWRGVLLPFFSKKQCAAQAKQVATELLASSYAEDRMDACRALRDMNDKSQLGKMRRLAETDPARSLERQRSGFWEYAFVTFPVRETCQAAVNQLELREGT